MRHWSASARAHLPSQLFALFFPFSLVLTMQMDRLYSIDVYILHVAASLGAEQCQKVLILQKCHWEGKAKELKIKES